MFIGRYYHTLEVKGRVSLPKTFRSFSEIWVITRGLDGGLFIFTHQDYIKEVGELQERTFTKKRNRDFLRLMANDAQEITPDAQGRVLLPEYLIKYANLKKDLVIIGSIKRIEIWDRERYHLYLDQIEDKAEVIAESIEITYDNQ